MTYPAMIEVRTPEHVDRWRPLVQWLAALPHLIIASAMESVTRAVTVVSWFIILFTGRLPAGLANVQVMILRYTTRAQLYAGFLTQQYPPFDFTLSSTEPGGYSVDLTIRPELEHRNRLTVGLRILLAIPALLFALVVAIVGVVCWLLAAVAVLITGHWPEGLRRWVLNLVRVSVRFDAYALLLTDEYPPFATS